MRISSTIVETEAYEGVHELASHSSKGCTSRTEVMFGPAGHFYVYRIYSHKSLVEMNNGVLYLNPGSAGPRRFNLPVTLAQLKIEAGRMEPEIIHLKS